MSGGPSGNHPARDRKCGVDGFTAPLSTGHKHPQINLARRRRSVFTPRPWSASPRRFISTLPCAVLHLRADRVGKHLLYILHGLFDRPGTVADRTHPPARSARRRLAANDFPGRRAICLPIDLDLDDRTHGSCPAVEQADLVEPFQDSGRKWPRTRPSPGARHPQPSWPSESRRGLAAEV